MASETYFGVGQKVKFSKGWWQGDPNEKQLMGLKGVVIDCDESPRECCYYEVKWDASDSELLSFGIDPDECWYESDALTKTR